jgi:hypothetical protein
MVEEEYPEEPLKGSLFRRLKGYSESKKKQKALEKKIFQKAYQAELKKAVAAKSAARAEQIAEQARRAAQNKAEGYTKVIARKFGRGALQIGKGILVGGKKSAPYVKKAIKAAEKATE